MIGHLALLKLHVTGECLGRLSGRLKFLFFCICKALSFEAPQVIFSIQETIVAKEEEWGILFSSDHHDWRAVQSSKRNDLSV
jgi:hypothetical protein